MEASSVGAASAGYGGDDFHKDTLCYDFLH